MLVRERIELEPSLDGAGWSVRIGESHWRFSRMDYAELFASNMKREEFSEEILDHAYNHDWSKCRPESCKGHLWQLIQGTE